MTELQKQFEEWAKKGDLDTTYGSYSESEYDSIFTQSAWESWQASRAAVVVKLPDWFVVSGVCLALDRDDVIKALDAAGVRYE